MVWIKAKKHLASWRIVVNRYFIKTLLLRVKKKYPTKLLPERQLTSMNLVKDTQCPPLLVRLTCLELVSIPQLPTDR